MRVLPVGSAVITAALLVAACTAPGPAPSQPAGSAATPPPVPSTTPSTSAPLSTSTASASGFPSTILGLPVQTVATMGSLAGSGALVGRFAAIAGYYMQYALPCPYVPHKAPIAGFCSGDVFADSRDDVATYNSAAAAAPLVMPETAGADALQAAVGNGPAAVVLVVHTADARSWQCPTDQRSTCATNVVIDSVAWINGASTAAPNMPTNLVAPGEQLITAYQFDGAEMNAVDPRYNGEAQGQVWYARTAYGPVDAKGTIGGVTRAVTVSPSAIVDERTLAVSDQYTPGRVVFDADQAGSSSVSLYPQFSVHDDTSLYVAGNLGSDTAPVALFPSAYSIAAWLAGASSEPTPSPSRTCVKQITIDPSSDVSYSATFTRNGCQWKSGSSVP